MAVDIELSMLERYSYIQALELQLEKSQKNYTLTCEHENSRRLRVDILFLQEENAGLQSQLLEKEERVDALEEDLEQQSATLEDLNLSMNNLRMELRGKMKDADRLKAEVNSLQALSADSAKLLEEKLALAREVNTLRPEIEHLRTQQTANANALAEKLALQRELQSVQVELENEKRAVQKAVSRDEGRSTRESRLENDLEVYKSDLAKEKILREKLERESQKNKGNLELQNASNESRLDEYRTRLKSAKEQIKSIKAELEEARKANERLMQEKKKAPPVTTRGKRNFSEVDVDATIGTPDGFPPKRLNQASMLFGEKSGFAVTPFLKQSKTLTIETPVAEAALPEVQDEETSEQAAEPVVAKTRKTSPVKVALKSKPKATKQTKKVLQKEAEPLENVMEDEEDEEVPAPKITVDIEKNEVSKAPVAKKKRRVLGAGPSKTLFDDDENVTGKIDSRGGLDDFKFAMPKKVTLAPKGSTALATKSKNSALSGFGGTFSPLKKDRKR